MTSSSLTRLSTALFAVFVLLALSAPVAGATLRHPAALSGSSCRIGGHHGPMSRSLVRCHRVSLSHRVTLMPSAW